MYKYLESFSQVADLTELIDYFNLSPRDKIKRKIATRYGYGIEEVAIPGSDGESIQRYKKGAFLAGLSSDQYEIVNTRFGCKVAETLANLFSGSQSGWEYTSPSLDPDQVLWIEKKINDHRKKGNMLQALQSADYLACAMESSIIRIVFKNGHLSYNVVRPDDIYLIYSDLIIDNGEPRMADKTDIYDAYQVSVFVGEINGQKAYASYLPKNEDYPMGRYYTHTGSPDIVHDIYASCIIHEHLEDGKPANPLSWIGEKYPEAFEFIPEIPIIVIRGGFIKIADEAIPVSWELYNQSLEIETQWSKIAKAIAMASSGLTTIENPDSYPLPESLEGAVVLAQNQKVNNINISGDLNSSIAALETLVRMCGNGYHIPTYYLLNRETAIPASGVALQLQCKPLISFREMRCQMNQNAMEMLSQIEKALISYHEDILLQDVDITYNFGQLTFPQAESEKMQAIQYRRSLGISDRVYDVAEWHEVDESKAVDIIQKMDARSARGVVSDLMSSFEVGQDEEDEI